MTMRKLQGFLLEDVIIFQYPYSYLQPYWKSSYNKTFGRTFYLKEAKNLLKYSCNEPLQNKKDKDTLAKFTYSRREQSLYIWIKRKCYALAAKNSS